MKDLYKSIMGVSPNACQLCTYFHLGPIFYSRVWNYQYRFFFNLFNLIVARTGRLPFFLHVLAPPQLVHLLSQYLY